MPIAWTWLSLPYAACAVGLVAMAVIAGVVRGDRVVRLGVIGSALTALPWALCTSLAVCVTDPVLATHLFRLGAGPVALIGPNLLLVLLAASGQLERHRWLARGAGIAGVVLLGLCWGTAWTVPGVRMLPSGVYYPVAGPLTDLHIAQLALWLAVGAVIARRAGVRARRVSVRGMLAMLALCAVGTGDLLVVHGIAGGFPVAWLPGLVACGVAIFLELRTDLLRSQGLDVPAAFELGGFAATSAVCAAVCAALAGASAVALALAGALAWVLVTGAAWSLAKRRPAVRVAGERALEAFVARLADVDDEARVAERLAALWAQIGAAAGGVWRTDGDWLVDVRTGLRRAIAPEVAGWLAQHARPFAADELQTMLLGQMRAPLEAFAAGAGLVVPLVDGADLVGIVEATPAQPLRDAQLALVAESAKAAARALTYVRLARTAAAEGATAREVEVADAMRSSASASRDDELGGWIVGADYRSAPHTTGAGWSAALLPDGRLALLVTEADAHGVPAALATAALSGAFSALTAAPTTPFRLDEILGALRASGAAMLRGREPIAAFLAVLDAQARTATWACAGHPGALLVEPAADPPRAIPVGGGGARIGAALAVATRGQVPLAAGAVFVVASSGARGSGAGAFAARTAQLASQVARLAPALVDAAAKESAAIEDDLLAVVVRAR